MFSSFMYLFATLMPPLEKILFSSVIFNWICCCYWVVWVNIFWILTFDLIQGLQIFYSISCSYISWLLLWQWGRFGVILLNDFLLWFVFLVSYPKHHCQDWYWGFFSRSFTFSCLMLKFLIHLGLIFVSGLTQGAISFFCLCLSSFPNTIGWRDVSSMDVLALIKY